MAWKPDHYTLVDASKPNHRVHIRTTEEKQWICPFTDVPDGWYQQPGTKGSWHIGSDGALEGQVDSEGATILWYSEAIEGDHMVEFQACSVPPDDNDINAIWEGSGEYDDQNPEQFCTIGGVGGWWHGYSGIERSLGNETGASGRFLTKTGDLVIGQIHNIAAGRAGEHDFLFVNGKLVAQVSEQGAPRRTRSKVALTTWNSHVKIYCIRISRITIAGSYERYRTS